MKKHGIKFLFGAAVALTILTLGSSARAENAAQNYPSRPITAIIPFAGGSASDANARAWSEYTHPWAGLIVLIAGLLALGGGIKAV